MGCVHCRDRRSNVGFPLLTSRNCEYPHVKFWSVESQSFHSWVIASTLPEQNFSQKIGTWQSSSGHHCHSKSRLATFQKLYCKSYSGHIMELASTKQTFSEQSRAGLPFVFGELWELGYGSTPIGFDRSHLLQLVVLGTDLCLISRSRMNEFEEKTHEKDAALLSTFEISTSPSKSPLKNDVHPRKPWNLHDESWFWLVQIYIFRFPDFRFSTCVFFSKTLVPNRHLGSCKLTFQLMKSV